eukprot:TRINITY_DN33281_c0_g3_i4.p1 TRINITY_DN33281_c0_g3~~TRINITY_DN33281_c0_g3_i4.p1  ORF type:complete len:385 (-),score=31.40 TRINITY_DN33281_c0_g3_i4:478-1632(-)
MRTSLFHKGCFKQQHQQLLYKQCSNSIIKRNKSRHPFLRVYAYEVQKSEGLLSREEKDIKRRILITVDDSEDSELAVKWSTGHVYREGDQFHVMHVIPCITDQPVYRWPDNSGLGSNESITEIKQQQQEKISKRFKQILIDHNIPYEFDIVVENLADRNMPIGKVICQMAEKLNAVVVMASHGQSGMAEFLLGSVSNYVKHNCNQPFLLLHNTHLEQCDADNPCYTDRAVVVAVSDSEIAEKACKFAVDELYKDGDTFHLLHVVPQIPLEAVYSTGIDGLMYNMPPEERDMEETVSDIKEYINNRFEKYLISKNVPYKIHVAYEPAMETKKSVGEMICKDAVDLGARMLVLGAHTNKSAVADIAFGSVSSYCTHNAEVPLVILH